MKKIKAKKALVISVLLVSFILFAACIVYQAVQDKNAQNINLEEILENAYREKMTRLSVEQIWDMHSAFSEYDELVDGYLYQGNYIIYAVNKEHGVENRVYLVKTNKRHTILDTVRYADEWDRNIFKETTLGKRPYTRTGVGYAFCFQRI